jgi:MinD superfamily P-loop ATPase
MASEVAGVGNGNAIAVIYRSRDNPEQSASYYFCCATCGNCGQHRPTQAAATSEASIHIGMSHTNTEEPMSTTATKPKGPSDAQIVAKLRRKPKTAADLGVTPSRLRSIEGVVAVGHVETGKRGRPATLWAVQAD